MEEDEPIEHSMISKAIENAQSKVEGHNFDIRKHLLEYDDVMNKQREIIYQQRREVLEGDDVAGVIQDMIEDVVDEAVDSVCEDRVDPLEWDWDGYHDRMLEQFNIDSRVGEEERSELNREALQEKITELVQKAYAAQEERNGADNMRQLEKILLLQIVDNSWKDHLLSMDHLKEGIGLRGYGQKDPLNEYKREGFDLFNKLMISIRDQTVSSLMRVRIMQEDDVERLEEERRRRQEQEMKMNRLGGGESGEEGAGTIRRDGDKIGRNAPCPCGSGKKYKKCCGRTN